jgi:hypothetical protein
MVSCCVNPACTAEHNLLSFDECLAPKGGALVRRRTDQGQAPQPNPQSSLRLVEHGARGVYLQRWAATSTFPGNEHSGEWGGQAHGTHI